MAFATDLNASIGNRGRVDLHFEVPGVSSHSSQPALGENPLPRAAAVVAALASAPLPKPHPDLGPATVTPYQLRFETGGASHDPPSGAAPGRPKPPPGRASRRRGSFGPIPPCLGARFRSVGHSGSSHASRRGFGQRSGRHLVARRDGVTRAPIDRDVIQQHLRRQLRLLARHPHGHVRAGQARVRGGDDWHRVGVDR